MISVLQTLCYSSKLPEQYRVTRLTVHQACELFYELRDQKRASGSLLVFITMGEFRFTVNKIAVRAVWPNTPLPQNEEKS